MTGATGNWYCGLHEPGEMGFVLHVLRRSELFVDVGANVGSYTVLAAGASGANVISFEPAKNTFRALSRNVDANGLADMVSCENCGVGARREVLHFTQNLDTVNHVASEDELEGATSIQVVPLDEILSGRAPRIAKIDVEGWEAHVLAGMPNTLADRGLWAIIMETNDSGHQRYGLDDPSEVLEKHGFAPYHYDAVSRHLEPGGTRHNTIFIRDLEAVQSRIATADRFRLVTGLL